MTSPRLAYAQARMAARHADRADAALWASLGASRSAAHWLAAARATPLARWVQHLDRDPDTGDVEAALELAFAGHVDEVSVWVGEPWAAAVRATRALPLLEQHDAEEPGAAAHWYATFRGSWPRAPSPFVRGVEEVVQLVAQHRRRMRDADVRDSGRELRDELGRQLERGFRRFAVTPAAALCHLGLTWLEIERLRGELLVRLVLPGAGSDVPWA